MNKTLTALTLSAAALANTPAYANNIHDDIAECQKYANAMVEATSSRSSGQDNVIRTGANVLGAIIAGRNPEYHISGGVRSGINGIAQDARVRERQVERHMNQCMRDKMRDR